MRTRRGSTSGLVPIGLVVLLAAFAACGSILYVSSAGTAATVQQLSETCRADTAVSLPIPAGIPDARATVEAIGDRIPGSDPGRLGVVASPRIVTPTGLNRGILLLHFDGLEQSVTPPVGDLALGEIAVPRTQATLLGLSVGDVVESEDGPPLTVAAIFDDVPFAPIPDLWCGFERWVAPTPAGDPPPPSALASPETIRQYPRPAEDVEYRTTEGVLTLTEARATLAGQQRAVDEWNAAFPDTDTDFTPRRAGIQPLSLENELDRVVGRAEAVTTTVSRSLAPVRLASLAAVFGVLVAAAVLLARERRRTLHLLVLRGAHPLSASLAVAGGVAVTSVLGAVFGWLTGWWTVTTFGPASTLEPSAITGSLVAAALVALVAVVSVQVTVAAVADRSVDPPVRRVHRHWFVVMPALALVLLALWSFRRLDGGGALRVSGVEARGGDLLALGFPLAMLLAATGVAAAVLALVVPRLRRSGRRLPRALRLGWRRVVLEPGPTVAAVAAVSLAAGSFVAAAALSEGAQRQFHDKAAVYVGSDLAVNVFDEPRLDPDVAARSTLEYVSTGTLAISDAGGAETGDSDTGDRDIPSRVEVIGVDRDTFTTAAELRGDGGDLDALLATLDEPSTDGLPNAVASGRDLRVGDVLTIDPQVGDTTFDVRVVAVGPFLPGSSTGQASVLVDQQVLRDAVPLAGRRLLVRDPPDDLVNSLRAQGVRTGVVLDADTAFDASNFSGVRWSYRPFIALGVLFALVAAGAQLLVVAARRDARRAAHLVMRRTGVGRRALFTAALVEIGVPLTIGAVVGVVASSVAGALAVPRLDPMPLLPPPAVFSVPWPTVAAIAVAVPVWAVLVALVVVRSTVRADPMKVLRGDL